MKYDPEYSSYKFSDGEFDIILKALDFYSQYSPLIEQDGREYISDLISNLEKTKSLSIDQ